MQRTSESGPSFDRDSKLTDFRPAKRPGQPGEYPYCRGSYPRLAAGRPWAPRQQAGGAAQQPYRRDSELTEAGNVFYLLRYAMSTDPARVRVRGASREVRDG